MALPDVVSTAHPREVTTTFSSSARPDILREPARRNPLTSSDAVVPPPSPAWFGAVMGSAILGTLSQLRPDVLPCAHQAAVGFWGVAVLLLIALSAAFLVRVARDRRAFVESIATPEAAAQWSMVSMGILAVGSATFAVLPASGLSRNVSGGIDLALWLLGTVIGVVTAVTVTARLVTQAPGSPTTVWGLGVVGPMVSATVGAGLVGWVNGVEAKVWLVMASVACFFLSLVLASVLFGIAYRHHWLVESLPIPASISAWLPLGIVGQSTAAAQTFAKQVRPLLAPATRPAVAHIGDVYSAVMMLIGVPLVLWALAMTVRGFRNAMPFSPGWWAMTFPVGTLVLGVTLYGRAVQHSWLTNVGGGLYLFLLGTWTVCAVSSLGAVAARVRHGERARARAGHRIE